MDGRAALRREDGRRRLGVLLLVVAWAAGDLLSTTIPDLRANRDRALLYYLAFVAAVALLLLSIAAPEVPAANRAADRLEE